MGRASRLEQPSSERVAPAGTEGEEDLRGVLQDRLRLFTLILAAIAWAFYLLSTVVTLRVEPDRLWSHMTGAMRLLHLSIALGCTAAWAVVSRRRYSLTILTAVDSAGTCIVLGALAGMLLNLSSESRPDLEFLLILNVVLVARAAIVPSTSRRTLSLGAYGVVLFTAAASYVFGHDVRPETPSAGTVAIVCLSWGTVCVTLTVIISRVIYGLQKRIDEVAHLGQYRLDEKIGQGGMGVVYRASHAMLRRPTAIKLLPPERMGTRALARFEREVQTTAKLTHPNTIAIYDYGRTNDGIFYYAMEYLEGLDLQDLVELDGAQSSSRVVYIIKQVAGALAEAHAAGLIHRDIKPANIILCERDRDQREHELGRHRRYSAVHVTGADNGARQRGRPE